MESVCEFLQKAHIFYVATVEGDQPRVRPFGIAHIIDGKLCIMTGKCKPVSHQLAANPKAEVCACIGTEWVRIAGKLIEDDRMETRQAMLDATVCRPWCRPHRPYGQNGNRNPDPELYWH